MDMRDVSDFKMHFESVINKLGEKKLDILCNNAGIQGATFGCAKEEDFDAVIETNYKGVFFLSQIIAHYMIDNCIRGNILNIASSSSIRPTNSAYSLSKACIKELTEGMAKYLIPHGIVVNGLAPGPTITPLMNKDEKSTIEHPSNPSGRYAMPEEIANMAVVLTSGIGRMVVGSIVYMTGGAGNITVDDSKYKFD
jgi:3-oxoacyl-[acyl-carrier protein] reductase